MNRINPSEVVDVDIVIHAMTLSGVCYASPYNPTNSKVREEDQVFVPKSVTERFNMRPGDVFTARLVPNDADMRDRTPWRSIYIYPPEGDNSAGRGVVDARSKVKAPPKLTDEQIKKASEEAALDGRVWTTRQVFVEVFQREVDHKDREDHRLFSTIGNHLRALQKEGKLYAAEIHGKTETATAVYFCSVIDELVPEGY